MNRSVLFLIISCAVVTGCGGTPEADGPTYESVGFELVGFGRDADVEALTETRLQTEDDWQRYAGLLTPLGELQEVDLEERDVLLIAVPVSSGGFDLSVEDVARSDDEIVARYLIEAPGDDCFVAQVMPTPFVAVAIPASDLPVRFEQRTVQYSCGVRQ